MKDIDHYRNRRKPTRMTGWDYGSNGKYFVTVCTDQKVPLFGQMRNSGMVNTIIGDYAIKCWQSIPEHYPFAELDTFILMPDHLHGILCFSKKERSEWKPNEFGPQIQNLAAVIRGFKSAVTSFAKSHFIEFQWEARYFDRIIRNDQELNRIREYILENPGKWVNTVL